jgi:NADPH-dependent 2,4-dienoyl-CoA reductase/sulfur reductase-like enzyme
MPAVRPRPSCASTVTTGPIVLIGDEPLLPYQRPPLSKAWLKGEADADSLQLKPSSWYADNNVSLRLGGVAVSINRGAKTVTWPRASPALRLSDPGHRRPRP